MITSDLELEFSESQIMARDLARSFAEKKLKPLAQEMDETEDIPQELLSEAAELGFFGMMISEKYGGLGLDYLAYVLAMEEIAKVAAAFQVGLTVHNSLVCSAILKFGTEKQKEKYLPKAAAGEWIGSYSLSEPGAGTDAGSLKASAVLEGDHYVLNGAKAWVTNAGRSRFFLVFVSTSPSLKNKGISCLIVDRETPGLSIGKKEKKLGIRASDTREIRFSNARVPRENLLGEENRGFKIALTQLNSGRIAIAAQSLGIARAAFEEAVKYSKAREQFGRPIADFQATQFKIADMAVGIEASRLLTYQAARLMALDKPCAQQASMAKLFASQHANKTAFEALQIHGGNGYIREFPVERYFRDARVTEIYEGTSEVQRLIIAREVLGDS